jgi:(1->4)-alpha-D-glucan 1-alpha-D-glucosylmutase
VKAELKDKVLLPILGDQYGKVLENQELTLAFQDGGFYVWYHDRRLPIAPRQYTQILEHRLDMLAERLGVQNPQFLEFQGIIAALHHLPLPTEIDPEKVIERRREKEIIKRRLQKLTHESEDIRRFLEDNVSIFNGMRGEPRSFDLLDTLLNAQVYRLAHWRVAAEEINYRRFFDVNDLAAIRMEDLRSSTKRTG